MIPRLIMAQRACERVRASVGGPSEILPDLGERKVYGDSCGSVEGVHEYR